MRNTCPKCNNSLTVKDVIRDTCSKCSPLEHLRSDKPVGKVSSDASSIRTNFDALISEELRKRTLQSAATAILHA